MIANLVNVVNATKLFTLILLCVLYHTHAHKTEISRINLKKEILCLYAVYKRHILGFKDINRLRVKGWKKIFHVSNNQRRAGVTKLSDKIDFKTKIVIKTKKAACVAEGRLWRASAAGEVDTLQSSLHPAYLYDEGF